MLADSDDGKHLPLLCARSHGGDHTTLSPLARRASGQPPKGRLRSLPASLVASDRSPPCAATLRRVGLWRALAVAAASRARWGQTPDCGTVVWAALDPAPASGDAATQPETLGAAHEEVVKMASTGVTGCVSCYPHRRVCVAPPTPHATSGGLPPSLPPPRDHARIGQLFPPACCSRACVHTAHATRTGAVGKLKCLPGQTRGRGLTPLAARPQVDMERASGPAAAKAGRGSAVLLRRAVPCARRLSWTPAPSRAKAPRALLGPLL